MKKLAFVLSILAVLLLIVSCTTTENPETSNHSEADVSEGDGSESGVSDVSSSESSLEYRDPADPDEIKLRITYCNNEILEQHDSVYDYADNIGTEKLIFIADEEKGSFSFVSIEWETEDVFEKSGPSVDQILFTVDNLTPEKPLVINNTNIPEIPPSNRGIIFKDQDGNEKYYYIAYSGKDGLGLYEFDNE